MNSDNEYISLASHAIGLDHKKPYKRHGKLFYRPYRNYYDASIKDCEIWDLMVDAGYAEAGKKIDTAEECIGSQEKVLIGLEKSCVSKFMMKKIEKGGMTY